MNYCAIVFKITCIREVLILTYHTPYTEYMFCDTITLCHTFLSKETLYLNMYAIIQLLTNEALDMM